MTLRKNFLVDYELFTLKEVDALFEFDNKSILEKFMLPHRNQVKKRCV
jgi:hypothetical protein